MTHEKKKSADRFSGISSRDMTTRLLKGGALLTDMRLLVTLWSDELTKEDLAEVLARSLPKSTTMRVRDVFTRAFRPRFLNGSPPQAWKLARVLEDHRADMQVIRSFYYWITARAEAPLYDFVTDVVYSRSRTTERDIKIDEAVSWLNRVMQNTGKSWTPTVTRKVARGILATLRDFGILEGRASKRIAPVSLTAEAFTLIAFCLFDMGISGRELVRHLDWRLFLLGETGVEQMLLECHQHGWLRYESVGNLYRTEFPTVTFPEYADGILH